MAANNKQVSVFTLLDVLRRRKLWVIVPVALITLAVGLYSLRLPVRYRAQALLGVESLTPQDYVQRDTTVLRVQEHLVALREALFSRPVLEQTITQFKLYPAPEGKVPEEALDEMRSRILIEVASENSFYVGFEGPDARQTADVANRLAQLFIERVSDVREQRVTEAAGFLSKEVEELRAKLLEQEQRLKEYKTRAVNELPDRVDTNLRMYELTQTQQQTKQASISNDIARRAAVQEELTALEKQGVLEATAPRERTPAEIKLDELRLELKNFQARYTPDHPEISRVQAEIADLERTVAATKHQRRPSEPSVAKMRYMQLKAEKEALDRRIESLRGEERQLGGQLGQLQRRLQATPQHETVLAELTRDYENTKLRYHELVGKQQETRMAARAEKLNKGVLFRIVEAAAVPSGPYTPHRERLLLMALLGSAGLGFVLAFFVEHLDSSFGHAEDFQEFTNLSLLAAVPSVSTELSDAVNPTRRAVTAAPPQAEGGTLRPVRLEPAALHRSRIVALSDPHSVAAEQYSILGVKVRQQLASQANPIVAVTSSIGGEGKTVSALNLAFALASNDPGKVLLVESDLRKPRVHEYLSLPASKGFSDLLLNPNDRLDAYLWKVGDLHVMPGGSSLENPVGLLASNHARCVMERLRGQFSFVIVDAPPILPIVDSHILAGLVDGVLLVVRARYTQRELFQRAIEGFHATNLLGAVLNDVDYERSRYAYAYKYYSKNYLGAR